MTSQAHIVPVVLAGGGGTRLWPLSRGHYPKQFLALAGEGSLLQQTLLRLAGVADLQAAGALVVCNEEHRFLVAEQARQTGHALTDLMLEPVGRNTAPALTAAALRARRDGADPILVMMPADQMIADAGTFAAAVHAAVEEAAAGRVVTLGVVPTRPETGYGYIETGATLPGNGPARHQVAGFREKPDVDTARAYLDGGAHLWNAGIFVLRASLWLELAGRFCPEIVSAVSTAVEQGCADGDFFRLQCAAFERSPAESIDYAVMEPLAADGDRVAVVALDAGWSDVGSWDGLWQAAGRDAEDNLLRGDVCTIDSCRNLVFADHRLVATVGCDDLVVVETADAVLVADRGRSQEVKAVVEWLQAQDREERLTHRRVYRPWGSYEGIDLGPRYQVKHITVKPGAALSLQMHHHRAEHWVVVSGTARVTRGEETFLLAENESTYIPIGVTHRLENPGTLPLDLIEVQSGSYLGEDDIVRFEDRYARG